MDKRLGNFLKYLISISVAFALLFYCFKQVKWDDFWSGLKACRWFFVVLSMAFGALSFYIRAIRWRQLLTPIDPTTSRLTTFNAINISYLANMVLPRVGELVRCGVITAHSPKDPQAKEGENHRVASYDKVLGTVVLERSWDVITMVLILVCFLLFTWNRFGGFFAEKIFGQASGKFSLNTLFILVGAIAALAALVYVSIRFGAKWKPLRKTGDFFIGIGKGFLSCLKMKRAWLFFVLTLMIWGCYWLMSASILWAVQGISPDAVSPDLAAAVIRLSDLTMIDALFLMLAGGLSSIVPVPGGFGAFHYIVALAISTVYGIPFQFGMLFATLSHESQTLNQLICGGLSAFNESLRKKSIHT